MPNKEAAFACEIRDTQAHNSDDDPDGDAEFTVVTDTLHPGDTFRHYDAITVHVENTHDQAFDVTVQSDHHEGDFTNPVDETTLSPGSGGAANTTFVTPRGKLRFSFAAPASSPGSGQYKCYVYASGPPKR